jgi:hypothetical protein
MKHQYTDLRSRDYLVRQLDEAREELRISYPKTPVDCLLSEIWSWLSSQGYNDYELTELFRQWKADSGFEDLP